MWLTRLELIRIKKLIFSNWLSKKTELERQDLKNGFINEWEDQYDIISKLTPDEKFCRVLINYFWSGFYSVSNTQLKKDHIKTWLEIEEIANLMYLTGNGCSF